MKFNNLAQMIDFTNQSYRNPKAFNFLQKGHWRSFSNQDFVENVQKLALALQDIGLKPQKTFGILANSSPIWLMMNFAATNSGAISVPIFSNIATENLLFEIKDSGLKFFFCDSKENLEVLLKSSIKFKKIIIFGFKNYKKNENIISFEELLKIGAKIQQKNPNLYKKISAKIKPDDISHIIYTSGSTGRPKGVEITHQNLIHQINGADAFFDLKSDKDVALSFLPLAHIFEGMVVSFYISKGISIYFVDDVQNLGKLLLEVKPTLMTAVPRMLEKTFSKIHEKVNSSSVVKRFISNLAFKLALTKNPDFEKIPCNFFFKKLVFQKLIAGMGGNLRMIICGGAPLTLSLEKFYNNIGIKLYVGYGLTEASPVIAANSLGQRKIGSVGKPFPGVKVKIVKGELLTKSPSLMKSYHNNEEQTKEVIDKNGWLKTGDLAKIDDQGFVTIIGRKKELFKTSGGKYISPVPIEQKLLQNCPFLGGALIIAEGRRFVSCLLFPDFSSLKFYQKKFKMENMTHDEFLNSNFIKNKIEKAVEKVNERLNEWEKIRKFILIKEELSIENGDMTPSMKLKRNVLEAKHQKMIDHFYNQ